MSDLVAKGLIEARMATYAGTLEIFWPNTLEPVEAANSAGWIRAEFATGSGAAFQADTHGGGGTFRQPGLFIASIFTPRGGGAGGTEADAIAALFRGQRDVSGTVKVVYRAPNIREVGADDHWYQTDVEVPYEYDSSFTT